MRSAFLGAHLAASSDNQPGSDLVESANELGALAGHSEHASHVHLHHKLDSCVVFRFRVLPKIGCHAGHGVGYVTLVAVFQSPFFTPFKVVSPANSFRHRSFRLWFTALKLIVPQCNRHLKRRIELCNWWALLHKGRDEIIE